MVWGLLGQLGNNLRLLRVIWRQIGVVLVKQGSLWVLVGSLWVSEDQYGFLESLGFIGDQWGISGESVELSGRPPGLSEAQWSQSSVGLSRASTGVNRGQYENYIYIYISDLLACCIKTWAATSYNADNVCFFKVSNKNVTKRCEIWSMLKTRTPSERTASLTSFWCLHCQLWTYFTPFSTVPIIEFEYGLVWWRLLN